MKRALTLTAFATASLLGVTVVPAMASGTQPSALWFSGQRWTIKSSSTPVGPGPNVFSATGPFVDRQGRLHLRVQPAAGGWTSSEVVGQRATGYGRYQVTLVSPSPAALDPQVVFGFFTWSDDPGTTGTNREIDVEASHFGDPSMVGDTQFVVQPSDAAGHLWRFSAGAAPVTLTINWHRGLVTFSTSTGASWTYQGTDVPVPTDAADHVLSHPRLNLWDYQGLAPAAGQPQTVVLSHFSYVPSRQ